MSITFEPTVDAPYPGLRPFLREESMVFFGRDQQIDEVLSRLKKRGRRRTLIGRTRSGSRGPRLTRRSACAWGIESPVPLDALL